MVGIGVRPPLLCPKRSLLTKNISPTGQHDEKALPLLQGRKYSAQKATTMCGLLAESYAEGRSEAIRQSTDLSKR